MYERGPAGGITLSGSVISNDIKPAPPGHAQQHAAQLHDLASRLSDLNIRLSNLTARLIGPEPPQPTEANNTKESEPSGILYVAAFGAQRIHREANRLHEIIDRLEQIA